MFTAALHNCQKLKCPSTPEQNSFLVQPYNENATKQYNEILMHATGVTLKFILHKESN